MSTEPDPPKPKPKAKDNDEGKQAAQAAPAATAPKKANAPAASGPPALDERALSFAELVPHADRFETDALIAMLRDGRGVVRANAALALAASSQAAPELVPLFRDSEPRVAVAAAEAITQLGAKIRASVPMIAQALDGARRW
ncbi:MAG: HEAT repeat domain-containing protein [Kofleriaceae bacterium]